MRFFLKIVKIAIAAAILGVAVFNTTIALNIVKNSDFTLEKIEALAQSEDPDDDGCFYTPNEVFYDGCYWFKKHCPDGVHLIFPHNCIAK